MTVASTIPDSDQDLPTKVVDVPPDVLRKFPHNKRVGNYLLGRTLGEGSFAKVKEGMHMLTGEKVAIKVIDKKRAKQDAYVKKNMRREGRILQAIQHPHVIQLYEVMETENSYYLVTELCKVDFMDYICKRKRLDENEVRRFIRQIVSAVDYLHRLGILHRDLKIENLLLDEKDDIKIIDFGLSNCVKLHSNSEWTEEYCSTQCGSPAYAAPELLGQKKYGTKIDVWSVGINMYAMLTGNLPFTVEPFNIKNLRNKMLSGQMNPMPDSLSREGRDFLCKLLTPDPDKRVTLSEAMKHIWITEGSKNLMTAYPCPNRLKTSNLNSNIIRHMIEKQGLSLTNIVRHVTMNTPSNDTAIYHLWHHRLKRHNDEQKVKGRVPACVSTDVKRTLFEKILGKRQSQTRLADKQDSFSRNEKSNVNQQEDGSKLTMDDVKRQLAPVNETTEDVTPVNEETVTVTDTIDKDATIVRNEVQKVPQYTQLPNSAVPMFLSNKIAANTTENDVANNAGSGTNLEEIIVDEKRSNKSAEKKEIEGNAVHDQSWKNGVAAVELQVGERTLVRNEQAHTDQKTIARTKQPSSQWYVIPARELTPKARKSHTKEQSTRVNQSQVVNEHKKIVCVPSPIELKKIHTQPKYSRILTRQNSNKTTFKSMLEPIHFDISINGRFSFDKEHGPKYNAERVVSRYSHRVSKGHVSRVHSTLSTNIQCSNQWAKVAGKMTKETNIEEKNTTSTSKSVEKGDRSQITQKQHKQAKIHPRNVTLDLCNAKDSIRAKTNNGRTYIHVISPYLAGSKKPLDKSRSVGLPEISPTGTMHNS